jgi:hypothetical protein
VYLGNDYVPNVFNTAFAKADYIQPLNQDWTLDLGLQYTDQRGVGDAQIGRFTTWNLGLGARLSWRGLSFGGAAHFTGEGNNIQNPYGSWPGYLAFNRLLFDNAGEKAWGAGFAYDFDGTLLPFKVPGLLALLAYARGTDLVNPATSSGRPGEWEVDLDLTWNVAAVKGLQFRSRNGYWNNGGEQTGYQFQLILNYEFHLL